MGSGFRLQPGFGSGHSQNPATAGTPCIFHRSEEMKKSGRKTLSSILIALVICSAITLPPRTSAQEQTARQKIITQYQKAIEIILENYTTEPDRETLTKSSIQNMLKSLDPHSDYLD